MSEKPKKPLMRYFGGKWILADWIISHFPPHRIYVEPFGGAASVLLNKERSAAEVYNDLDKSVYTLFTVMRDHYLELARKLKYTPCSREEYATSYEDTQDPIELSRRLLVRGWMGFGGERLTRPSGFRTNIKYSRHSSSVIWRKFLEQAEFICDRLQGVTLECGPAIPIIQGHDMPHTLFYVDPPYPTETRSDGSYAHEMTTEDHKALAEVLRSVQGMVILSGYACELYDTELYADWYRVERQAYANTHNGNEPRTEVLWINPAAKAALDKAQEKPPMLALLDQLEASS